MRGVRLTYGICADGGVIQIGWEDAGITDSSVRGLDVIRAEWYRTEGSPSNHNDAVLSLTGPIYDTAMQEHHRNITISDVRIFGTVGRILGLGLYGTNRSTVQDVVLRRVSSALPLQWWPAGAKPPVVGDNFLVAEAPDAICGVTLEDITIAGKVVLHNRDWMLNVSGQVSGVRYYSNTTSESPKARSNDL